ncbi:hypothetical protein FRX31_007883 [Thalictrum thalictroides]|uniref:Uncharacterized protein n=1 Tax=Thalictrum thalictroides TaxID=46969 RepID=A0A7J6X1D6_THATH|nr:hypothetical protein FRX31_007883 [Thalictrum thalictroides]
MSWQVVRDTNGILYLDNVVGTNSFTSLIAYLHENTKCCRDRTEDCEYNGKWWYRKLQKSMQGSGELSVVLVCLLGVGKGTSTLRTTECLPRGLHTSRRVAAYVNFFCFSQ